MIAKNNRRNHSPDQFESVVVRNETRFAIRTVIVLRRKPKQQGIDNEEYHEDDGHIEVHQPVDCQLRAPKQEAFHMNHTSPADHK